MGGGNPIKKVFREAERIGGQIEKGATAITAVAADPTSWVNYAVNPTYGMGMQASKAQETWQAMSAEERSKAQAEAEAAMAAQKEREAKAAQEKMIADKAREEARIAKDRAARLGQGRRGLLYAPTGETGVKSKTLGG